MAYDPALGTWTSEDPDGYVNGINLYQMERSQPVGISDPNGTNAPELPGWEVSTQAEFNSWAPARQAKWVAILEQNWGGFIHSAAVKYNVPWRLLETIIVTEMIDLD